MAATIPYSVRISRDLLEEMRRYYDRMEAPKPTFSAILSHILGLGWETYVVRRQSAARVQEAPIPSVPKTFTIKRSMENRSAQA